MVTIIALAYTAAVGAVLFFNHAASIVSNGSK